MHSKKTYEDLRKQQRAAVERLVAAKQAESPDTPFQTAGATAAGRGRSRLGRRSETHAGN